MLQDTEEEEELLFHWSGVLSMKNTYAFMYNYVGLF